MNQLMQRVALLSFLGCLAVIAIASGSNPRTHCAREWKTVQEKTEISEVPGKIFYDLID